MRKFQVYVVAKQNSLTLDLPMVGLSSGLNSTTLDICRMMQHCKLNLWEWTDPRWKHTVLPPCWVSTHLLCPWARQLQYKRGSYMRSCWDDSCILPQHERQAAPKSPFSLNVGRYQLGEKEKKDKSSQTGEGMVQEWWYGDWCVPSNAQKPNDGEKTAQGGFSNNKEAGRISGKNWLRTTCDIHLPYFSCIWGDKMK